MSVVAGINAFLSTVATTFFAASIGASSLHYATIKTVNWVRVENGDDDYYFGFKAAALHVNGETSVTRMNHCAESDTICSNCGGPGGLVSLALLAIALSFAFLTLITAINRVQNPSTGNKLAQIFFTLFSWVFGVGAFGRYRTCFRDLRNVFNDDDVHYGPGLGLCVCASALMIIAFFLSLIPGGENGGGDYSAPSAVESSPTSAVQSASEPASEPAVKTSEVELAEKA